MPKDATVIDDALLSKALSKTNGEGSIHSLDLVQTIPKAKILTLSFSNILCIDNLHNFNLLTKLCLDNNYINQIINLEHLENLTWLDLSFNNIKKIEGLNTLIKLSDLSLFHNQIEKIEGLNNCKKLQCLSIGENKINTLESIISLRQFPFLYSVSFYGNPVCDEIDYKSTILGYLPHIKYLDYSLILEDEIQHAREQFLNEILELQEKEEVENEKILREEHTKSLINKLEDAGIGYIQNLKLSFFNYSDNNEDMIKIFTLPGIHDLIDLFHGNFDMCADMVRELGLNNALSKDEEKTIFEDYLNEIHQNEIKKGTYLTENFHNDKKKILNKLNDIYDNNIDDKLINNIHILLDKLNDIENILMTNELEQVQAFEQLIKDFEINYKEYKLSAYELQQRFFREVEMLENSFTKSLTELANELIDKLAKDELTEELSEETLNLIIDRDSCMNSIHNVQDFHINKLLKIEDEAKEIENNNYDETLNELKRNERERNRRRVGEIQSFLQYNRRVLQAIIKKKKRMIS